MNKKTLAAGCVIAGSILASTSAQAAVLVSENYDSKNTGNLIGQNSALGSTGLSGNYSFNGAESGQTFNVVAGGLAFSTYSTAAGNSLIASSANTGGVAVAGISLAASHTGTLYSSYLINFSTLSTNSGAALTRITSGSTATSGTSRFNLRADTTTNSAITPGISYGNANTGLGANLAISTTYMIIGRFTNVGTALNNTTTQGVASMFALTAAQWDSFTLAGSMDSYLDTATVGTGAGNISARATNTETTGTFSFANGNFVQTVMSASTTSSTQTFQFDNLLYGTSLADVAVVPEPSAALLGALGALALLRRRR